jgi:CMP-N,N'-diacetyllegionaminic acid synthase
MALIPARRDSKRLPNKNRLEINHKSLVERAILCAKGSRKIDEIVVFSNDDDIRKIASKYKDVIFEKEPECLAKDNVNPNDYIRYIERKHDYSILVLLQPTSPIRMSEDVDRCIDILLKHDDVDSVVTVRRDYVFMFSPNGSIYVQRRGKDSYNDNMVCVVLSQEKSLDINTLLDFKMAKYLLED